jgi:DNA polymerase-3 subunit delta
LGFKEYKRQSKRSDEGINNPENLLEEVKKGKYKPVMIFFGEERMRIDSAVDYIKKSLLGNKINEFNYDLVYCEEGSGVSLYQSFVTPPFMGKGKLIVARDSDRLREEDYSELSKALRFDKFNGSVLILVYYAPELSVRGKKAQEFIKVLKGRKAIYRFDLLSITDLEKRKQSYLRKFGITMDSDAFSYLVQELGNSQEIIFSLLSQLVMYEPEKKRITLSDIKQFIFNFRGFTVYDFTNAIANKRVDEALRILDISGNTRENLIQIVSPVVRMLEQLYKTRTLLSGQVSTSKIAEELGIPVKIVESEFIPQARNFSRDSLIKSIEFMSRFDVMLRTSTLSPEMIVSKLLLDLCI